MTSFNFSNIFFLFVSLFQNMCRLSIHDKINSKNCLGWPKYVWFLVKNIKHKYPEILFWQWRLKLGKGNCHCHNNPRLEGKIQFHKVALDWSDTMPLVLARSTSFLIISDLTQINFRRSVQERVLSNDLLAKGFCDYLKMIWNFCISFGIFFQIYPRE